MEYSALTITVRSLEGFTGYKSKKEELPAKYQDAIALLDAADNVNVNVTAGSYTIRLDGVGKKWVYVGLEQTDYSIFESFLENQGA